MKAAREAQGLTQEELAREVRKSKAYICLVENGKRVPSPLFIERVAQALGADMHEWMFIGRGKDELKALIDRFPSQVERYFRSARNAVPKRK